jgi:hypothetical protein
MRHALIAAVLVALSFTSACAGLRAGKGAKAQNNSAKDCAACAKMCEVAGDAENNAAAVNDCKADCQKQCK